MTWILRLNDMRSPRIEILSPVAQAETKEELQDLILREMVEPYRDGQWGKCFRKGGPLEWFNKPDEFFGAGIDDIGTEADTVEQALNNRRRALAAYPLAGATVTGAEGSK